MNKMIGISLVSLFILLVVLSIMPPIASQQKSLDLISPISMKLSYLGPVSQGVTDNETIDFIRQSMEVTDKLAGHSGIYNVASLIAGKLQSYSIPGIIDNYTIVVPVDHGSILSIGDMDLKVYPLWPSGGVPTNVDVYGRIVVLRSLRDADGTNLKDTIVLLPMNIDYQWQWLLDPHLGVKAILFYGTNDTVNSNMYDKYLDVPVSLPTGYLPVNIIAENNMSIDDLNGKEAHLILRSKWCITKAPNIYAYIPGSSHDYKIVLVTHYDSWSPAIGFAPGASDMLGPAYLLRMARKLVNSTPQYDTLLLFLSGHYIGLAGQRYFVEKYLFNKTELVFGDTRISLDPEYTIYVGIDLYPGTIYVAPVSIGYFYTATVGTISRGPMDYFNTFITSIYSQSKVSDTLRKHVPERIAEAEKRLLIYATSIDMWWTIFPGPYWLDTEPFWFAGLPAFTLRSALANRGYRATPLDTIDKINFDYVATQYAVLDGFLDILYSLPSNELAKAIKLGLSPGAPTRTSTSDRLEMFANLVGQVMVWQPEIGQQVSLKKAGLPPALVIISAGSRSKSSNPWNIRIYTYTDDEGYFTVYGLPTSRSTSLQIKAIVLSENGTVLALNDMGQASHGSTVSLSQPVTGSYQHPWEVWTVKYVDSITINMLIDPLSYQTPKEGAKFSYKIVRRDTLAEPSFYHLELDENGFFIAYVQRNMNYSIVIGPDPVLYVFENVVPGKSYSLYDALSSTSNIVKRRIDRLVEYKIRDPATEEFIKRTIQVLRNATDALERNNYTEYRVYVRTGITLVYNSYQLMKNAYLDVENTATLFSVLLVLFAFVMALYFRKPGGSPFKALGKTIIASFIPGAIFFYIHPAFHLTANAIMTIIGFIMIILVTPALLVLLGDFNTALKEIRKKKVGAHAVERSRVVASYMSFSYGVEYMKKRRLRTLLTLITLIVVVISIVIFTSVSTYVAPRPIAVAGYTPTRPMGLLLQREAFDRNLPMGEQLVENIQVLFRGETVARYWGVATIQIYSFDDPRQLVTKNSIIGLDPEEDKITNISKIIVRGRWFTDNDTYTVILPADVVNITNGAIDVGKYVSVDGVKLRVIGLYDSNKLIEIVEGDGGTITPVIGFPRAKDLQGTVFIPSRLAVLNPWLDKGVTFFVGQISVKTVEDPMKLSREIIYMVPAVDTYLVGSGGSVAKYSRLIALGGSGFNYVLAPIIIASVSILGVLLGSIYERRREIFIYAALGLSPTQIGLMFIAEALAYALVATVIGYVIGVVTTTITAALMPEIFKPNYSSKYVVFALGATIVAVLSATIYPVFKASKMALPSLRRKWEYPTKPKGDEWTLPLPFKITSEKEVYGALYYVYEYIKEFTSPDLGNFVVEKIAFTRTKTEDGKNIVTLAGEVRLKPWHAGIKQCFSVQAVETKPDEWEIVIHLKRISGHAKVWVKSNKPFIDALRKQLLLWRTLRPGDKKKYIDGAKELFA